MVLPEGWRPAYCVVCACATAVVLGAGPAAASGSARGRHALYNDAVATTRSWSVHYASNSTESKRTLVESGDAGPASGKPDRPDREGDHLHPRHRRHHLSARATPMASRAWPD